jgi:hypothetical protein
MPHDYDLPDILEGENIDMGAVVDALDPDRRLPEVSYEFSNGRKFRRPEDPYAYAKD